jgi:hypothetical protein
MAAWDSLEVYDGKSKNKMLLFGGREGNRLKSLIEEE